MSEQSFYARDELEQMAQQQVAQVQAEEPRWYDGRCSGPLHLVSWSIHRNYESIDLYVEIDCDENEDHHIANVVQLWST